MKLLRPVEGPITQAHGVYPTRGNPHPIFGDYQPYGHLGIDYAAPIGTPVRAAHDGTLDFLGWSNQMPAHLQTKWMMSGSDASGICVHLDAGNGLGTTYNHMNSADVDGLQVKRGQIIGYTGNTGRSGGPHLHFELVRIPAPYDGRFYGRINPQPYIDAPATITPASASITPAAPKPAPKPAQKEWYEMALDLETKKDINEAVWGGPGMPLIENLMLDRGEWAKTHLGALPDRIIRQHLVPMRQELASQNAQIKSLVGAVAALAKGEPFDEAKLLAGIRAAAASGVKDTFESIESTTTTTAQIKGGL